MPVTLPNGSLYKLVLLDTNALSEIVKNPDNEGEGFKKRFPPGEFVPCFTAYNLIELRRKPEVYAKYIKFFEDYPSFITKPHQHILELEIAAEGRAEVIDTLLNAFTPLGPNSSYDLANFIEKLFKPPIMAKLERDWKKNDQEVLNTWLKSKAAFKPTNTDPNKRDAKQFVRKYSKETLQRIYPTLDQTNIDIKFPSMQMMLYSQYYRIYDPSWEQADQEVTDVSISACAPYVDAVITENFQANIYTKVQKHIAGMSLTIARLRDIRL